MTVKTSEIITKLKGNVLNETGTYFYSMQNPDPIDRKKFISYLKGRLHVWLHEEISVHGVVLDSNQICFVIDVLISFIEELGNGRIIRDAKIDFNNKDYENDSE